MMTNQRNPLTTVVSCPERGEGDSSNTGGIKCARRCNTTLIPFTAQDEAFGD